MEKINQVGTVRYQNHRLEGLAYQVARAVTHLKVEEGELCSDWLAAGSGDLVTAGHASSCAGEGGR